MACFYLRIHNKAIPNAQTDCPRYILLEAHFEAFAGVEIFQQDVVAGGFGDGPPVGNFGSFEHAQEL